MTYLQSSNLKRYHSKLLKTRIYKLFSVNFIRFLYFFSFFLSILKRCYTFAAVNELAMTYQTTTAQQRNFDFFAFFSALYLVVSDILLTHTHTHTHTQALLTSKPTFFVLSYARVKRGVTLVNKGLHGVSFVRFFVPICELSRKQNKNVLSTDFITKDNNNSLIIVCFLSLISRAGSDNTLSACREERQSERINNEFVRMYI